MAETVVSPAALLCPWCRPARLILPDRQPGPIWLGKGERTDGICAPHKAAYLAALARGEDYAA